MKWLLLTLFLTTSLSVVSIHSSQENTQKMLPKGYFAPIMDDLAQRFSQYSSEYVVIIHASEQKQYLLHNGMIDLSNGKNLKGKTFKGVVPS